LRRPVVAKVACRKDLDDLIRVIAEWRRDFAQVRNRLACYTASSSDPHRNAKIEKWKKIADDCEAMIEKLEGRLSALSTIMTGLSDMDWIKVAEAKRMLRLFIADQQAVLDAPQTSAIEKIRTETTINAYKAILRPLDLFES
jgi:hypothetical protein